jgi:hypothetical protein
MITGIINISKFDGEMIVIVWDSSSLLTGTEEELLYTSLFVSTVHDCEVSNMFLYSLVSLRKRSIYMYHTHLKITCGDLNGFPDIRALPIPRGTESLCMIMAYIPSDAL